MNEEMNKTSSCDSSAKDVADLHTLSTVSESKLDPDAKPFLFFKPTLHESKNIKQAIFTLKSQNHDGIVKLKGEKICENSADKSVIKRHVMILKRLRTLVGKKKHFSLNYMCPSMLLIKY